MEIDRQVRDGQYPTAESIALKLEVSPRVIYADRCFLRDRLGAPLEFDRERGGWTYTDPTYVLPSLFASEGDLIAFFLSLEVARRYLGTPFEEPIRSAVQRLSNGLGNPVSVDLEQLRQHYSFAAPTAAGAEPRLLADMEQSIRLRRRVRITYYTAGRDEWNERTVDPYHLRNAGGEWVLIAFDHLREAWRDFNLARVAEWAVLPEAFERDPAFSPEAYLRSGFMHEHGTSPQPIVIRFDAYQARWIRERRWHETQQPLEPQPDGGVILRFCASGLGEVKRWVMQYGPHAEVLEPESLRREVAEELRAAARRYGIAEDAESTENAECDGEADD